MDYTLDQEVVFDTELENFLMLKKKMSLGAAMPFVQLHIAMGKFFEIRDSQTGVVVLGFQENPEGARLVGEDWLTDKVVPEICESIGKLICVLEIRPDLNEPMKVFYTPKPKAPF